MNTFEKTGLGFVHNGDGMIGKAIIRATTPLVLQFSKQALFNTPSHVFIWFEDKNGCRTYFEALESKGWRGPLPISEVTQWVSENPGKRWARHYDLSDWFSEDQMQEAYDFCIRMKKYWTYNAGQLGLMLRTVAPIANEVVPSSPNAVVCSEAGSRVLHNDFLDFREICGKKQHDHINPRQLMIGCEYITSIKNTESDTSGAA